MFEHIRLLASVFFGILLGGFVGAFTGFILSAMALRHRDSELLVILSGFLFMGCLFLGMVGGGVLAYRQSQTSPESEDLEEERFDTDSDGYIL